MNANEILRLADDYADAREAGFADHEWEALDAAVRELEREKDYWHADAAEEGSKREDAEQEVKRLRELLRDAWVCATDDDIGDPFWEQTSKAVKSVIGVSR